MLHLLGCPVPEATLSSWIEHFVFPTAPYYLTDADLWLVPATAAVLTRAEYGTVLESLPMAFQDAYRTYRVSREAAWVALLSDAQFLALPPGVQAELGALQERLGRYHASGGKVLLHQQWRALCREEQTAALARVVGSECRQPCLASSISEETWAEISGRVGPAVRHLAGVFEPRTGPNCFATALAGAVLVWVDGADVPQHACFALGAGLALNKNAMNWWAPRQVVPIDSVVADWAGEGYRLETYL